MHLATHIAVEAPAADEHAGFTAGGQWRRLVELSQSLPASPAAVFAVNASLSATPVNLKQVSRIIQSDLSLSAQMLRLANAAALEHDEAVWSIEQALVLAGVARLRTLVLTTALLQSTAGAAAEVQALWEHSALTARLAERVAEACQWPEPGKAAIAGLLHDIGKLPLIVCECPPQENKPDHCEVGAWMAVSWRFPGFLVDAIEHHHAWKEATRDPQMAAMVAAADRFAHGCGLSRSVEKEDPLLPLADWLPVEPRQELSRQLESEYAAWLRAAEGLKL